MKFLEKFTEPSSTAGRIHESPARLAEKDKSLMERTAELNAAHAFLIRVNAVSEEVVVGMAENLNILISSTSGALDSWDCQGPVPVTLVEELDTNQIRGNPGSLVSGQITTRNPVAANLAIQMSLGYFVERVTSDWGGVQATGILGEIYCIVSIKGK